MVKISSDASDFGWEGLILSPGMATFEIWDYWVGVGVGGEGGILR